MSLLCLLRWQVHSLPLPSGKPLGLIKCQAFYSVLYTVLSNHIGHTCLTLTFFRFRMLK